MRARRLRLTAIGCIVALSAAPDALAGGDTRVVYDASGTMRIIIHRPAQVTAQDHRRTRRASDDLWWYGYRNPAATGEGAEEMDPALNAPATPVYRFVYTGGSFDGGYYSLYPYGGWGRRWVGWWAGGWVGGRGGGSKLKNRFP